MSDIMKEIDKTFAQLILLEKAPFLVNLLFSLNIEITNGDAPLAAVDGVSLFINEDTFPALSNQERQGLLVHEASHVAWEHIYRAAELHMDNKLANQAMDHEINLRLLADGWKLPAGGLWDARYRDMPFEKIYQLLKKEPSKQDPKFKPDILPPPDGKQDEIKQQVQDKIINALTACEAMGKDPGNLPADLLRAIQKMKVPTIPWEVLLMRYFNDRIKEEVSWTRRNRRVPDIYLPSKYNEVLGCIAVYEDLSGSITEKQHTAQIAQMQHIKNIVNPKMMTYNGWTTVLGKTQYFTQEAKDIKPDWNMSGGTNVNPVIEDILKNKPEIAVIFTDGYFSMPTELHRVHTDIIWVIVGNPKFAISKGKVIYMEY